MSNDLVIPQGSFLDRYAKYAAEAQAQVASSAAAGNFISTKSGVLSYNGTPAPNNKLDVIVIDFVKENHYYDVAFDADSPRSPVCYAFGDDEKEMEPHADSEKPQAKKCSECPRNKFPPKLPTGKQPPKECKNVFRLALIPSSPLTADAVESADAAYLRVPVMSGANWKAYVEMLAAKNVPPFVVLTQIGAVPDQKSQFKLTFAPLGVVPDALLEAVEARHEDQFEKIQFGYRRNDEAPAEESSGEKKFK